MTTKYAAILVASVLICSYSVANTYYDEQMLAIFHGTYSQLAYNVTVEPNADTNYVLNGYTASGYWYQVIANPPGCQVYHDAETVFGCGGTMPGFPAYSKVRLSLSFSGDEVLMQVKDWNTGAEVNFSYGAFGASQFIPGPLATPTGLLTEIETASEPPESQYIAAYSPYDTNITLASLGIDEVSSQFPNFTPNHVLFAATSGAPASTAQLSTHGAYASWDNGIFTTGTLPDPPIPQLSIGMTTTNYSFDSGQPLRLDYRVSGGVPSYYSSVGCGATQLELNATIPLGPGSYGCTLTVRDSVGAQASVPFTMAIASVPLKLTVVHGAADVDVPVQLVQATGGTPPYSYWWSVDGNDTELSANRTLLGVNAYLPVVPVFNFTAVDQHSIVFRTMDRAGDVASLNMSVPVGQIPGIELFRAVNSTATIVATGGSPPFTFSWYLDGELQGNTTAFSASNFTFSSAGNASVQVTDQAGYMLDSNTIRVIPAVSAQPSQPDASGGVGVLPYAAAAAVGALLVLVLLKLARRPAPSPAGEAGEASEVENQEEARPR